MGFRLFAGCKRERMGIRNRYLAPEGLERGGRAVAGEPLVEGAPAVEERVVEAEVAAARPPIPSRHGLFAEQLDRREVVGGAVEDARERAPPRLLLPRPNP